MDLQNGFLGRLWGWSKQDTGKEAPNEQEEIDAAEPPTDLASIHEPFLVSPTSAEEIMLDLPDQSAEDAASIVNDLALNDVSSSPPKPAVLGKRKRQETDAVDDSPKKRAARGNGINGTQDERSSTSTNGITGHGGSSHLASSEVVNVASRKLPRPKKEQRKRHMAQTYPAVQSNDNYWEPAPSPKKQVEKALPPSTTTRRKASSSEVTPRPRGRPRVRSSTTKTTSSMKNAREGPKIVIDNLPQRARPKAQPKARPEPFRAETGDNHTGRAPSSKSTRSTAAAEGRRDAILNANTDLTKKPERDARRAAKHRKSLEQASVSTPPSARVEVGQGLQNEVGSEEHAEEEEQQQQQEHEQEKEERGIEGRKDLEEVIDRNGQTPVQMDEGEEGGAEAEKEDSDFEDPIEVFESDEEEDKGEEELELFGQDRAWRTVFEGARSICGPKLPFNHMPKLLTDTVKGFVNDVREARVLYEQLLPYKGIDHNSVDGLNDQLEESLDAIEDQIRKLSEKSAATKSSQMIRDIYARAIPAMVYILHSALASRVYSSDEPCDLKTLNGIVISLTEILRLQDMTILLCEKARLWKAKPVPTSQPIRKPTTQKMYPKLKVMRNAFAKKLSEQKRRRKVKQNDVDTRNRRDELSQLSQQAQQEVARKNEILHRRIRESREQEEARRRNVKRTFQQFKQDEMHSEKQITGGVASNTLWSDVEDLELYFQLEKGYEGRLTSTFMRSHPLCQCCSLITLVAIERYSNILNTRLLQNKLPEHIRERALYFKPTLLEERGPLEWISSIE